MYQNHSLSRSSELNGHMLILFAGMAAAARWDVETETPTAAPTATSGMDKAEFTHRQKVIVCSTVFLSCLALLGGAVLTCWCRYRNRWKIPTELEQNMLVGGAPTTL